MHEILTREGISQRELAKRTGWKESFVSRLLSGDQNPTILTLARFEDAVGHELLTVTSDTAQAGPTLIRNDVSVRVNGAR
jgi:transcriptional regulator with XRE-family HTH domain